MNGSTLIDRSLKALARRAAPTFCRLAGVLTDPSAIHWEDVTINLPEYRADQVLLIGEASDPERWGMHLEFQLEPSREVLPGWFYKNAALTRQLGLPVLLTAVYLTRGRYARFPAAYVVRRGNLENRFVFDRIRLWEHAERIRSGELQELAPLLVLCENNPTEATLREERELILRLPAAPQLRSDLLAVAVMVGTRYFSREVLLRLFREEMQMLKEASVIQDWLDEAEAGGARRLVLRLLRERFGELPPGVVRRVEEESAAWCEDLAVRIFAANSLRELGL
jgi:hypothetical protein